MNKPHIAYFSTEYPCVSHTFIRREIHELEKLGYRILRVSGRKGPVLPDPLDVAEAERTQPLIGAGVGPTLGHLLGGLVRANFRIFSGLMLTLKLGMISSRGLLKHLAYFLEALILLDILRAGDVDHLHIHFGNNAAAIGLICKALGGPDYSLTVHGPDEFDAPVGESLGLKVAEATFVAAITHFCTGQIKRWAPYSAWERLHIVHCTVGEEWFEQATPLDEEARDIVCVGRLIGNKGQVLLVEAFAEAVRRGYRGNLVLIGDGEMRDVIEARVSALRLEDRVVLAGWQSGEDVQAALRNCRAFVLASFSEGLPVVLMEAMACKRPVITTQITGVPELVEHEKHGWLVIAGDQQALTDALLALDATSLEDLRNMGEAAHAQVRKEHSAATEAAKLDTLFSTYLTERVTAPDSIANSARP